MTINRKRIEKRIRDRQTDKKVTTFYISQKVLADFKKACGDLSISEVVEELMKEYLGQE
jgi:hypothetical protein